MFSTLSHWVIGVLLIQTITKYHKTPIRMARFFKTDTTKY